ncbi:MAG: iron-sulfur cluster assembly scaffold protein [Calditrichaeota bacterium]|nr:iron-sulfur cluster assembly scaffold protein [Calditrichota bacterium]
MSFSPQYIFHFTNPCGVGDMENPDVTAQVQHEGGGCFDRVKLMLRIADGAIVQARFLARACSGTIAACSALVASIEGKSLVEAEKLKYDDLITILGGIPEKKQHSIELAIEALKEAMKSLQN